jgi:hypothetical protein
MANPRTRSMPPAADVETWLSALDHPCKEEVLALRRIILAADPAISEEIKWNVPSFRTSEHFATLNLRVKKGIGVILHFGAKKNEISTTGVAIDDPEPLLEWLANDRALVTFRDSDDIAAKQSAFVSLVREWIKNIRS